MDLWVWLDRPVTVETDTFEFTSPTGGRAGFDASPLMRRGFLNQRYRRQTYTRAKGGSATADAAGIHQVHTGLRVRFEQDDEVTALLVALPEGQGPPRIEADPAAGEVRVQFTDAADTVHIDDSGADVRRKSREGERHLE